MFRVRCKRKFGFQVSICSSFLGAIVELGRLRLQILNFKSHRLCFLLMAARFSLSSFWFGFKYQFAARLSMRSSRVGSATPSDFDFQVSKTRFYIAGSALFAFFFSIGFHGSKVFQDSTVLLRVSTQENTLLSTLRTACRDSMLRKVGSSGRSRKFAPSARPAKKHLIASQSRFSSQKNTLFSASRIFCKKSMLHKSETCGRFWKVARLTRRES